MNLLRFFKLGISVVFSNCYWVQTGPSVLIYSLENRIAGSIVTHKEHIMETSQKESCMFEGKEYAADAEVCRGDDCRVCVDGRMTEWKELCCPRMLDE
jgi:hypothetical protein